MQNKLFNNLRSELFFLCAIVFLSRVPFLWAGFGSEEDSWLLALTAKNISLSGTYEMSRAPAHPLQEFLYAMLYNNGMFAFATNLLSAIASVIATLFFALALKQLNFKHYLYAGFVFAFTPVVFISSTYTIDYMLAMAFVMMSFYFLLKKNFWFSGILLGLSIGFRITSGAMLIPFCILFFPLTKENMKNIFIFFLLTAATGLLTYIPVIKIYGTSFFTFADQFPYPSLPKVFYKATLGVFGAIGILAIIGYKIKILGNIIFKKEKFIPDGLPKQLFFASCSAIIIYIISYLQLPQKSAYFIPLIPFVILLFGYYLSSRSFKYFCVLLTMSSFFLSMNLTDSLRGSKHSPFSVTFNIAGQEIFVDALTGPVYSDYTKRLNKIAYTEKVYQQTRIEQKKIVLICGWWYNELLVRSWECWSPSRQSRDEMNQNVILVFYIDKSAMEKYLADGYEIYYLPEQNLYNDQYSQMNYTDSVAKPYLLNSQDE